jgi:chromosome condensin MukBEF ATPase and DNA-binding subunit MukB
MNMANEISSMETELQSLRAENEVLKTNRAVIDHENESLRRALAASQADRDNWLRRGEALKALLDQTGANLVAAMNKYHEAERDRQIRGTTAAIAEADEVPGVKSRDLTKQFNKMAAHG